MKSLRAIIFIALILGGFPLGSFAQSCGNLVINPVTGLLDCAGTSSSGGGVTNLAASNGVGTSSGAAITTTGTLWADWPRNAQVGTSYALVTGDRGKVVTFSNAASIAVTINEAGTTGFEAGWLTIVKNNGAGTVTITPTTSTIDGALTLVLYTGDWALISSAGGQYETINSKLAQSTGIVVTPNRTGKTVLADTTYLLSKGTDQSGATKYCASTDATGTSYTCNLSPTLDVANLVAGSVFIWNRTNVCSTGTGLQLQIDSTGAKNVYMADGSTVLTTTDCAAGRGLVLWYNGTHYRVLGGEASSGGSSAFSSLTGGTNTGAAMIVGAGASFRANAADATAPNKSGTSLPATCSVGDTYLKTDAVLTQVLYTCSTGNVWTQQQGTIVDSPWWVWGGMDTNNVIGAISGRQMRFYEFTVLAPGKIVNGASVATGSTGGIFAVGIYDSSCALLAQTSTVNISAFDDEQWLPLSSAQTLKPGKYYYGIAEEAGTGLMRASLGYYYLNGGRSSSTYGAFTVTGTNASYSAPDLTLPSSCSGTRNNLSSRTPFVVLQ